ncbi:MAG: PIN domain-containing protein [Acidobacteria bacterium]|nr:PIN domain-containing protein [Acidobacteriota bacterium]
MIYVFDANAMIALLNDEPGADVISEILTRPDAIVYAHAINLAEVFYWSIRHEGEAQALLAYAGLQALGIQTRADMDEEFWQTAAGVKASHRMALADAFAIALALRVDGVLITSDHRELGPVAAANVCRIVFFR